MRKSTFLGLAAAATGALILGLSAFRLPALAQQAGPITPSGPTPTSGCKKENVGSATIGTKGDCRTCSAISDSGTNAAATTGNGVNAVVPASEAGADTTGYPGSAGASVDAHSGQNEEAIELFTRISDELIENTVCPGSSPTPPRPRFIDEIGPDDPPPPPPPPPPSDGSCGGMPGPPSGGGGGIGAAGWDAGGEGGDLPWSAPASIRHYSQITLNRMTANWWFPWDVFVIPQPNGDLKYYEPGVVGLVYSWDAINQVFVSPPGQFDVIVPNTNGTWTRTTKTGIQYQFNSSGYLIWVRDRHGLQTTVNRSALNVIQQVTDYAGRTWSFAYHPSSGYLASITDFAGAAMNFGYNAAGQLASITYPTTTYFDRATTSLVTRGQTITMQYVVAPGSPLDGNLASVIDDAGNVVRSYQYDPLDRITTQTTRGGTWTYSYAGSTTVTDPDGVTIVYSFDPSGRINRKDALTRTGLGLTPLRAGEPSQYTWTYTRGAACLCDQITNVTRPDGSTIAIAYDNLGNPLSRTHTPAPGGSGARTETWTWSSFAQYSRPLTYVSPRGNEPGASAPDFTTTWTYNGTGDPITATYPKATVGGVLVHPTVSCTYTANGQLDTFTATDGVVTKYQYAATTLALTQVTRDFGIGRLNSAVLYGRDAYGRITSLQDPNGNVTTFTWNALHQLTERQAPQPLGGRTQYVYDNNLEFYSVAVENKDSSGIQDPANPWITTTFVRDSNNHLVAVNKEVDASTIAQTQLSYTAAGRLQTETSPVGDVVRWDYDERGLLFTQTDGFGSSVAGTWRTDYDANGNPARHVNPRGYATNRVFDVADRMVSETHPDGRASIATFDADGNLVRLDQLTTQGVLGRRVEHDYDPLGLRTQTRRYPIDAQGIAGTAQVKSMTYGADLRVSQSTDYVGATTTYVNDALGRRTRVTSPVQDYIDFVYDAAGNLTSRQSNDWNQVTSVFDVIALDYTYDALGRITAATRRDGPNTASTSVAFEYDSRGNLTRSTDAVGNTVRSTFNAMSLRTVITYDLRAGGTGAGAVVGTTQTQTAYDLAGRITSRTDGQAGATQFAYDARGRIASITDATTGARTFTRDANGNPTQTIDPLGTIVVATYDSMDRLTGRSITRASGVVGSTAESYAYDAHGRMASAQDDDTTVQFTYDSLSRMQSETEGSNPIGSTGLTFTYQYNAEDQLTTRVHPDATVELVARDSAQRISSVAIQGGATLGSYSYVGADVAQVALANSVLDARTRDALHRTTWVTATRSGSTLTQFQYLLDAADHRLLEKRHHSGGVGDNYTLDSLYRAVAVKVGVADPMLEHQTPGSQTIASLTTSTYNAAQSRTAVSVTAGGATTSTTFAADGLQFYTSVGATTQVRDANGNLTDDGTLLYEYDYRSQLSRVKVKATGAVVATYEYDCMGRRVTKAAGASAHRYVWSGGSMTGVYDSQGLVSRIHYGAEPDVIVSAYQRDVADLDGDSSTTDYVALTPLYDGAFDCVAVVGPSGAVAERYVHSYDGGVTVFSGAGQTLSSTAIGWTQGYGRMWRDDETGLCYARLRYYTPKLGRFITSDVPGNWWDAGNLGNGFAWLGNRYRNGWDPLGLVYDEANNRADYKDCYKAKSYEECRKCCADKYDKHVTDIVKGWAKDAVAAGVIPSSVAKIIADAASNFASGVVSGKGSAQMIPLVDAFTTANYTRMTLLPDLNGEAALGRECLNKCRDLFPEEYKAWKKAGRPACK